MDAAAAIVAAPNLLSISLRVAASVSRAAAAQIALAPAGGSPFRAAWRGGVASCFVR